MNVANAQFFLVRRIRIQTDGYRAACLSIKSKPGYNRKKYGSKLGLPKHKTFAL